MMKDDGKRKGQNTSTHKNPEKELKLETPKTERKKVEDRTSERIIPKKKKHPGHQQKEIRSMH